jgi:hypothetical protein
LDYIDGANLIANEVLSSNSKWQLQSYCLELMFEEMKRKLMVGFHTLSKSQQQTWDEIAGGTGINNGTWYNSVFLIHNIAITSSL